MIKQNLQMRNDQVYDDIWVKRPPAVSKTPDLSSSLGTKNKYIPTDRNHNPVVIDHYNHPLFQQPKFTKKSPKVLLNNPITGYVPTDLNISREGSQSPERRRGMADYGNMMVGSNNKLW